MPTLEEPMLRDLTQRIFEAADTPSDLATVMSDHLIESSLAGHDSHGIRCIPPYIERVREGTVVAAARPSILEERPASALVSGRRGWGQVTAAFGMDLAIRKAKQSGVAVVGLVQHNHIGRVGTYPARAAVQGVASFVTVGGLAGGAVLPYGGREGRYGTNPLSFGFPAGSRPPFLVDFATTVIAGGKVLLALAKGEPVPEGVLLDADGNPTTDPAALNTGGALLPFGGHKGYGLALVAGLFGGLLSHAARHTQDGGAGSGTFMLAVDATLFGPLDELAQEVDTAFARLKQTPPAPGFDEVLIPGEPEDRSRELRLQQGIPVAESTWQEILAIAAELGVTVPE